MSDQRIVTAALLLLIISIALVMLTSGRFESPRPFEAVPGLTPEGVLPE